MKLSPPPAMAVMLHLLGAAMVVASPASNDHPRLWLTNEAEESVRAKIREDALAARFHQALMEKANSVIGKRTCRYEIPDGRRLLAESRLALHNVMHAGWAWRMTGEEKFRARVITELEAACSLKDWNPSHFLDTAEMATAVTVGYDWLFSSLTPGQRAMCEKAVLEKALIPAREMLERKAFWSQPRNNWSQVCGAGIALAAAVVPAGDADMRADLVKRCLELVDDCGTFYQPDGLYPEGPGYWHYGTNYHVMLLAGRRDLGFGPGASEETMRLTGQSMIHLTGPSRLVFNFADCSAHSGGISPAMCWLASRFDDPLLASKVRSSLASALDRGPGGFGSSGTMPLGLLWLPPEPRLSHPVPTAAVFRGAQPVAVFRTGWDEGDAWFAIKGGTSAVSHGHMDAGSFVYDAHGCRWFHDLGGDNYNLPGYFGDKRWNYFRLQNRSHNTLEIGGLLQDSTSAVSTLTETNLQGDVCRARFDLTPAYRGAADKVTRAVAFKSRTGDVCIEDEVIAPRGAVVWRAFTDAEVELRGVEAVLSKKEGKILLRSNGGEWRVDPATPPTASEHLNGEFRTLVLEYPAAEKIRIKVGIHP